MLERPEVRYKGVKYRVVWSLKEWQRGRIRREQEELAQKKPPQNARVEAELVSQRVNGNQLASAWDERFSASGYVERNGTARKWKVPFCEATMTFEQKAVAKKILNNLGRGA